MLYKLQQLRGEREEGFTLVEIMIVVVIIGMITAFAVPIFVEQQKAAIRATMKLDLRTVSVAVQTMLVKNPKAADTGPGYNWNNTGPFEDVRAKAQTSLSHSDSFVRIGGAVRLNAPSQIVFDNDGEADQTGRVANWKGWSVLIANNNAHAIYAYDSKTGKMNIALEDNRDYEAIGGNYKATLQ